MTWSSAPSGDVVPPKLIGREELAAPALRPPLDDPAEERLPLR